MGGREASGSKDYGEPGGSRCGHLAGPLCYRAVEAFLARVRSVGRHGKGHIATARSKGEVRAAARTACPRARVPGPTPRPNAGGRAARRGRCEARNGEGVAREALYGTRLARHCDLHRAGRRAASPRRAPATPARCQARPTPPTRAPPTCPWRSSHWGRARRLPPPLPARP